MAKKCAIIPQVRNSKNEVVSSRLFKDLLAYAPNRQEATRIYLITKSQDFITNWNPILTLDENGEPTLSSLLKKTNLKSIVGEQKVLTKLNEEIGHYHKTGRTKLYLNNDENYRMLVQKAIQFNTQSEFREDYVASVEKVWDNESNRVYISPFVRVRNKMNSIEANNMQYNENLNNRLREILAANGISIGALTGLEQRRGVAGVTDFSQARDAATGIIELIRLAEGIKGERALPEEFAHFAIEAMGDNPLINRLINHLANNGLVSEILGEDYSTYDTLYKSDESKLAREAAGKLLAKHLLQSEPIPSSSYKSLLERFINAVKNFFKGLGASQFQKAMLSADSNFAQLANDILTGQLDEAINVENIATSEAFYSTTERVDRDKKLLQKIIDNELKRLKIYEKRNPNSQFSANQRLLIDRLELELADNSEIEGIYMFLDNALEELRKVSSRLEVLRNTPASNLNERAGVLRDIRNYMYSYKRIADSVREALREEEKSTDNRYGQRVRVALDNVTTMLNDLAVDYNTISMPLFVDFIKPFVGDNLVVPFGKYKGKTLNAEELIKVADEDISFFDRWLDSMADSSDYMLKVMDQAVKKSKEQARLKTIEVQKELQAVTIKLEQAGVKDTEWMFEKDSKGNKSGNYISEINHALFRERMRLMFQSLNDKYGKNPVGENADKYNEERQAWFNANMETVDGVRQPKKSIYESMEFRKLNKAQKEYYNTIMDIKAKLDALLPDKYTKLNSAVKIRKDLVERVKNSESVKAGTQQIWENIKDNFIRRTDDTDFGDKATVKDFEDREVQMLPIYFTKLKKGESANDISTDIVGTLTAYAAMANDFDEMNKVIDVLEVGRDILRERQITQTSGGKPMVEKFKAVGRKVESKLTKTGDKSRFMERLNDFFEMQVYGRYMADEGTFGKTNIDKGKVANFVNRMTSMNNLALNILSGISNVATGKVMMRIESFSGEFFSEKDTLKADKTYGKELPTFLAQLGDRVKTNKLALWDELFNVMQEYEQDVREVNFDRKTWFSRMFGTSALFFMNNAGEHWMQTRTSLALANAYKMKAPNGKLVSLWDAFEVVPLDRSNKKLGAKLQLKQGYTKADGSAFTQEDIIKFSRKSAAINQRMHGIYNKADRSAVQRLAIGRLGMMFRKWMRPSWNRRFNSATYNYDLQAWTEGYYRTTGRFFLALAQDMRQAQFDIASRWGEMTQTEKANVKRALTEVAHFLAVTAAIGLIEWSDDRDRPWLVRMVEYQLRRLYTELGAMLPGPPMSNEGFKLLQSPAAGVNTLQKAVDLVGIMNPFNYETFNGEEALIKGGQFEGYSKAQRILLRSPLVPMRNTILKGFHPEESIPFYKQ
jgi:hypothetical protein|nr:MAG TPA: hypothetical protein [Crassvirales sp.]